MSLNTPADFGMVLVAIIGGLVIPMIFIACLWISLEHTEKRVKRLEAQIDRLTGISLQPSPSHSETRPTLRQ